MLAEPYRLLDTDIETHRDGNVLGLHDWARVRHSSSSMAIQTISKSGASWPHVLPIGFK